MIADLLDPAAKHHTDFQLKFIRNRVGHPGTPLRDMLLTLYRDAVIRQEEADAGKLDAVIKKYEQEKGLSRRSLFAIRKKAKGLRAAGSKKRP